MNTPFHLHNGDCLDVLKSMESNSVHAIVTDPPYGLSFMGKKWDYDVPSSDIWAECLRVLKPGGHLLAFAGTRTQHRMAVRIEDAGFEIRDLIMWVYGSGFPKSHDVSKSIDKNNGEVGRLHKFTAFMRTTGLTARQINEATGTLMGSHYLTERSPPAIPTRALWANLRPLCGSVPAWVDELVSRIEAEREVVGQSDNGIAGGGGKHAGMSGAYGYSAEFNITAPATEAAKQWDGWGTALKPAVEPITVARKPFGGTVASNVLEWGTGALNIDGCRVATTDSTVRQETLLTSKGVKGGAYGQTAGRPQTGGANGSDAGRWPANFIHDGSDEVVAGFPVTKGAGNKHHDTRQHVGGSFGGGRLGPEHIYDNGGSAARFFYEVKTNLEHGEAAYRFKYCAKASKKDRDNGLDSVVEVKIEWSSTLESKEWEKEARKVRLLVDTEQSHPKVIGVSGALNNDATEWSTMLFGSVTTDKYSPGSMCTTKTRTSYTTQSEILSLCQSSITSGSIPGAQRETAPCGSHAASAESNTLSITSTNARLASALGADHAAKTMQLKISASAARSGHPTVKPVDLMAYLCRLVTPPGGTVLDPFMGSGSTGKAAMREGFKFIGIEREPEYFAIAEKRIQHELQSLEQAAPKQLGFFQST